MKEEVSGNPLFTRHLFRSGCICPAKLYYKSHRATYPEQDVYLEHLRYNKKQMTRLLYNLFPEGVRVAGEGHHESAFQTEEYLERENVTLFDTSFIFENCFARASVLQKTGGTLHLYQVQTKALDPGRQKLTASSGSIRNKWKPYLLDFSYQLYVIMKKYPDWVLKPHLVVPNKNGLSSINGLDRLLKKREDIPADEVRKLLVFLPVMNLVERFWRGEESLFDREEGHPLQGDSYGDALKKMREWYVYGERIFTNVGKKCISCEYRVKEESLESSQKSGFRECWREVLGHHKDKPHVFELIGAGTQSLLSDGIYLQKDIPLKEKTSLKHLLNSEERITVTTRRRLQLAKNRDEAIPDELVKEELFSELKRWEYPIHFLDFEAGSYSVPLRARRKPYHLEVFQYSCHTLYQNGTLSHNQWIHSGDNGSANFELVQSLREVPQITEGTVVQYSEFERGALRQIVEEIKKEDPEKGEEMKDWINGLIRRNDTNTSQGPFLADLSRMVRNYYFNSRMEDSLSVKDVVRSVMEVSSLLRERFSTPYTSQNLGDIIWWQQKNGQVRSPYDILRDRQFLSVGRGTEAMVAYAELRTEGYSGPKEERVRRSLQAYCELDTLAMVMIYLHWNRLFQCR